MQNKTYTQGFIAFKSHKWLALDSRIWCSHEPARLWSCLYEPPRS